MPFLGLFLTHRLRPRWRGGHRPVALTPDTHHVEGVVEGVPLAIRHLVAVVALSVSPAGAAHADEPGSDESEDAARTDVVRPVFDQTITNIPGKSMVAQEVSYAPGGKDGPHRHAQSAFIMA
jgi:hypothetical protein